MGVNTYERFWDLSLTISIFICNAFVLLYVFIRIVRKLNYEIHSNFSSFEPSWFQMHDFYPKWFYFSFWANPTRRKLETFCWTHIQSLCFHHWKQIRSKIRVYWAEVRVRVLLRYHFSRDSNLGDSLRLMIIFNKIRKWVWHIKTKCNMYNLVWFFFSFLNKTMTNESWISKQNC